MAAFAEQLITARKAAGMTQQQLADAVHVTRAAISHWETGRTIPDFDVIQQIKQALNCTFTHSGGTAADQSPAADGESAAKTSVGQPAEAVSDHVPQAKPVSHVWKWAAIAAVCVLLVIVGYIAAVGIRNAVKPPDTAKEYVSDMDSGIRYVLADFEAVAPNRAGQAYLTVVSKTETMRGDNASYWMYTFTFREDNGIAYHIDRMENIWFKKDSAHPFVFMADDLRQAGLDPDIPARGQFSFDGGFPLDQPDMIGVGVRVYGHDETGAESSFTGYIPFPQS